MKTGICHISCIPMRSGAGSTFEMVSQLLLGETYEVLEEQDSWLYIRTAFDAYHGWINDTQWFEYTTGITTRAVTNSPVTFAIGERSYILSMGSELGYAEGKGYILKHSGEEVHITAQVPSITVEDMARTLLGSPYLWGGRNFMGIDCSGLVQVLFKTKGIQLSRDARDQALQGESVAFLEQAQPGDLAFFDNAEGKIIHVGILLSPEEIIHASGMVRKDRIDAQGIIHRDTGKYSHRLRLIRRITV